MTGIIDVGGGMKAIFGAGVLDYCLDNGIGFDLCMGISAGSANLASFIAGQCRRNYLFYTEYSGRKQYMSLHNFLFKHSYIDLDYVYGGLSNSDGENPLDFDQIMNSKSAFKVVATNAITGKPMYFDKSDMRPDNYQICMASSSIPIVCSPYVIDGVPYLDGGISDPIPLRYALDSGCDRIVLVLSRPKDYIRTQKNDLMSSNLLWKKYPNAAKDMFLRYKKYNSGIEFAKRLEEKGKVLILAPDSIDGIETLTKNPKKLAGLYIKGYESAVLIKEFLES